MPRSISLLTFVQIRQNFFRVATVATCHAPLVTLQKKTTKSKITIFKFTSPVQFDTVIRLPVPNAAHMRSFTVFRRLGYVPQPVKVAKNPRSRVAGYASPGTHSTA